MGHPGKPGHLIPDHRDIPQDGPRLSLHLIDHRIRRDPGQVRGKGSHIFRDRQIVVVQDHQKLFLSRPGLIKSLHGHPRGQGAVSDDGNHMVRVSQHIAGLRHSQGRGD